MKLISMIQRTRARLGVFMLFFAVVALSTGVKLSVVHSEGTGTVWKSIIFGQSISESHNQILIDAAHKTVTLIAGKADGSAAGGKITGSHDGISYYYTEIDPSQNFELSAMVRVNFFAKASPDRQEAFGIMARDAIGKHLDVSVFASNMVMVGGYRGLLQSVFRNHVQDVSGAGAKMEEVFQFGERPANDGSASFKLTLKKTNTGYHAMVDDGAEKIYYRPKQLEVLDKERIYVGFFAARVASITVSDIQLSLSDAAADPPGEPEPSPTVTPALQVGSLAAVSQADYALSVTANVPGRLLVIQDGKGIYDGPITAEQSQVTVTGLAKGTNHFELVLTPDASAKVTSAEPLRLTHTVTFKSYGKVGGNIFVSPAGRPEATGSQKDPIDIHSAVQFVRPGQTIYMMGGIYQLSAPLVIERGNNGTAAQPKVLSAYKKERPVLDFGGKASGILMGGDYWKIYGLDVTKSSGNGIRISGNYNQVELVNIYANLETGLQISGLSTEKKEYWPAYNLILNCTAYDNKDASENNADGFAAKLTVGEGNVFRGCIAHNNCDDGWDLYAKLETGPIGAVVIENCIAYGNGTLSDGTPTKGDGNGFKLGGEGIPVKHVLRNSLAFNNDNIGVTSNSNPLVIVENTTSADNKKANFGFTYYANATPGFYAKNNLSFRTAPGEADLIPEAAGLTSNDNYFYNGTASVNALGESVSASDFKEVVPTAIERKRDGSIDIQDYLAVVAKSKIKSGARLD